MKNNFLPAALLSAAILLTVPALAQEQQKDKKVYNYVEHMPQYEGGIGAMMKFIGSNVSYAPSQPEGTVVLGFIVDKDGTVDSVHVVKSLSPALDEACVRAVKATEGKWTPGEQQGKPVAVRFSLPIRFGELKAEDVVTETMPEYKGGVVAFRKFMKQHARYPNGATKHGTVVVSFIINEDGSLSDYKVKSSVEPALDRAALRLAKRSNGNWLPSTKDGKTVKVQYAMPVYF